MEVDTVMLSGEFSGDIPLPKLYFFPVPSDVDTQAVLKDYFSKKAYNDTIINIPELKVTVIDTVTQNKVVDRFVYYEMKPPVVKQLPRYGLSVSAMVGYRTFPVMLELRKDKVGLLAGYDFYNKSPMIGAKIILGSWK